MIHYAGLDVSKKTISLSVVNDKGREVLKTDLPCDPSVVACYLKGTQLEITKIGLESGTYTHWLTEELSKKGFDVVVMESRQMAAILSASKINKNDANDAKGIAKALRGGYFKKCVHRRTESLEKRTFLNSRHTLVEARRSIATSIKGLLRPYGINVCSSRNSEFSEQIEEAISSRGEALRTGIFGLLESLKALDKEIKLLDKQCKKEAAMDEDIKLLKTMDGVGDIVALAYASEIDDPNRFSNSRNVPAYIGVTPKLYESGEISRHGSISKRGTGYTRQLLVEAAIVLLTRVTAWSDLKAWGHKLMKKKGLKKAAVAVARRMAIIMHRMLITREPFCRSKKKAANAA